MSEERMAEVIDALERSKAADRERYAYDSLDDALQHLLGDRYQAYRDFVFRDGLGDVRPYLLRDKRGRMYLQPETEFDKGEPYYLADAVDFYLEGCWHGYDDSVPLSEGIRTVYATLDGLRGVVDGWRQRLEKEEGAEDEAAGIER